MSDAKPQIIFLALATMIVGAGLASSQTPAKLPSGDRFLDLLQPGQRVRMDHQQGSDAIHLTLVPEARWKRIKEQAEERRARIQKLEAELDKLEKQRNEALALFQPRGRTTGLDGDAIAELQQAQRKIQGEMDATYRQILDLRQMLPSSIRRVEVVGEDYFGIDGGTFIVFYPASRLREITRPKEPPEGNTDQEATAPEPAAEPTNESPSPANDVDAKN